MTARKLCKNESHSLPDSFPIMYFIVAVLMFIMKYWIAFVSVKEKKRAALT